MTVLTTSAKMLYTGNGVTTTFAVTFPYLTNHDGTAQLAVYLGENGIPLVEGQDYTIIGFGKQVDKTYSENGEALEIAISYETRYSSGEIVFNQAPQSGVSVAIVRNVPATQGVVFVEGEDFPAADFGNGLDKLTMREQQIEEQLSRAMIFPPTSTVNPLQARNEILTAQYEATAAALNAGQSAKEVSDLAIVAIEKAEEIKETVAQGTADFNTNAIEKTNTFNANAVAKTNDFDSNAESQTAAFDANAAEKQAEVDALAALAKQYAQGEPTEPDGYSAEYWAKQAEASLSGLGQLVATIEGKIPAQASASNQLTDKAYVDEADNGLQSQIDALAAADATFQPILVSGTNIKSVNGISLVGSGNVNINGLDPDNKSIMVNAMNQLQAIGVIDQNDTSMAVELWTGSNVEYEALEEKDPATLYVTQEDITISMLEAIWPVGAIYLATTAGCPLEALGVGKWELVAKDRCLQGAGGNLGVPGETIEAGAPNIVGTFNCGGSDAALAKNLTGAFYLEGSNVAGEGGGSGSDSLAGFDASRANAIYGNSETIQPPAFLVNIFQRVI
ncbi:MAG: hypothetical protein IJ529_06335 [Alphaproteobacteria bacterium]|nr:hypothetical protein [Alphaproteobacteria bacterium]MBQ9236225.1 hypothetical protein [Alphaproteobacteria bacterium]